MISIHLPRQSNYDPDLKIWSGRKVKDFFHPKITIGEVIRSYLIRDPNRIAQINDNSGVSLTNYDILQRSYKIGYYIQKLNLNHTDVAGVIARNTDNLAPLIFGLLYCGVTINTLNTSFNEDEINHLFQHTKPKVVFCDSDVYPVVKSSMKTLSNDASIFIVRGKVEGEPVVTVADILKSVCDEDAKKFVPNDPDDGRLHTAFILCSSGTTGLSKGVRIPHSAFLNKMITLRSQQVILCFSQIHWISGLSTMLLGPIGNVTRIITDEPFSPALFLRIVEKYRVNFILVPPSQLAMIANHLEIETHDLSSVTFCVSGGSRVHQSIIERIEPHLPNTKVHIAYGLTELVAAVVNCNPYKAGSCGRLSNNLEMKIICDKDGSQQLGPNEDGEICLRRKYPFVGYCGGKPDEFKNILDEDGWIHTGDIGHMDDDGFLFVVDRKKDIMKYRGYHISPSEIEAKLLEIPDIAQVCVCGIPYLTAGELPAALIIRKDTSNLTEVNVHEFIEKNLFDAKKLRGGVHFVSVLPMTKTDKISRRKVQEIAISLFNDKKNVAYFNI